MAKSNRAKSEKQTTLETQYDELVKTVKDEVALTFLNAFRMQAQPSQYYVVQDEVTYGAYEKAI